MATIGHYACVPMVQVLPAHLDDKVVIRHLLELCVYDFSEFTAEDVNEHGLFGYRYFDQYWTDADRSPFLLRCDGRIAGFALVRSGDPNDMAEFFIMRKYRRRGIGIAAARSLFAMFAGDWQVRQLTANAPAIAFWRRAIPVPFSEVANDKGPVQRFTVTAAPST